MTSRELLAVALLLAPALTAILVALAPRGLVTAGRASRARSSRAALAVALAAVALGDPNGSVVGTWIVVDPAAGLLVGVIGIVGLASVLVSPAYLASARSSLVPANRSERLYFVLLYCFWAILLAVPLAGNLGAAWLLVEATTAASALLVGFSGQGARARGGLEVPDPHLARPRRGAARDRAPRRRGAGRRARRALLARAHDVLGGRERSARRLPPPARGARGQDRLRAGAQLAPRRARRGSAARLGAPLGCPAPGRARRRLAVRAGARAGDRSRVRRRAS